MSYILYLQQHGPLARIDGDIRDARLRDGEIAIPCAPDADVNDAELWALKAAEWENHVPTLEEAKTSKRGELMAARDRLVAAGFDWNGHHYPLSPELSGDMLIKLTAMQMLPPPPEYVYQWKDAGGVYRNIGNAEAFKTFCAAALGYGEALFARERMLQELVEAAKTVEAVEAVSWDTVPEGGGT
nr:DUF4376 domain-containing protein [uncultured Fretibacterium sp.]